MDKTPTSKGQTVAVWPFVSLRSILEWIFRSLRDHTGFVQRLDYAALRQMQRADSRGRLRDAPPNIYKERAEKTRTAVGRASLASDVREERSKLTQYRAEGHSNEIAN